MRSSKLVRFVAVALVGLILGAGCSGDDAATGTTEAVQFGEGSIPDSIPANIPVPDNAVIGTTLVDKINNRTEFRISIPDDIASVIQFFQVGLVNQGYIVESSEGNAAEWTLTFSNGDLRGTIFTTPQGSAATTSVITVNRS
jgi:hypothetical protein